MKKELISPIFSFLAMVLIVIVKAFDDDRKLDIIGYVAIIVAIYSLIQIIKILRKKED